MEMEWNGKWDLENLVSFGSKAIENPKKLQLADWPVVDDAEMHAGSFNQSAGGGESGASGSGSRHGSSAKSSLSASTDSDGIQTSIFKFTTTEGSSKKIEMKGIELCSAAPPPQAEALLGLKLGKRTYFENSSGGGSVKNTSFSVMPTPSTTTTLKKSRSSGQICCQVEGCNVDLSGAKEYHRKHRVCDSHSKCPKVIVGGHERRFCQQCSRFHKLSEFDEAKRSCRRRLSDHNARRRKPQQETIHFNFPRPSTPFYGGMNLVSNSWSTRPPAHSNSVTKGCWLKFDGDGQELHMPGSKAINMQNGFLASKNPVFNPGSKISCLDAYAAAAPEYDRALSLLSTNSWDSQSIELHHQLHHNDTPTITHPIIHEGLPFSSTELWPHSTHQPLPPSYDHDFYSSPLN